MYVLESDKSYTKMVLFSQGLKSQDFWQWWVLISATTIVVVTVWAISNSYKIILVTNRFFFNKSIRIQDGCQCYPSISIINIMLVLSKNATTISFYLLCVTLWKITMFIMNLWSSADSGMLWSRGCRIWCKILLDIGITNNFYWQIFLLILYSEYLLEKNISFSLFCFC